MIWSKITSQSQSLADVQQIQRELTTLRPVVHTVHTNRRPTNTEQITRTDPNDDSIKEMLFDLTESNNISNGFIDNLHWILFSACVLQTSVFNFHFHIIF